MVSEKYVDLVVAKMSGDRNTSNPSCMPALDSVDEILAWERKDAAAIRIGIQAAVLASVAGAAALSLIPFESNFASVFAGQMMRDLCQPAVGSAINAPIREALDRIFPVNHLSARQIIQGFEYGALSLTQIVNWAVDVGLMDQDIKMLCSIAEVIKFNRETQDDFNTLQSLEIAKINADINTQRLDLDETIADVKAALKEVSKMVGVVI